MALSYFKRWPACWLWICLIPKLVYADTPAKVYPDSLWTYHQLIASAENESLSGFDSEALDWALEAQKRLSQKQDSLVQFAERFLGLPYIYGGTTPYGFDCSGFTQYVYKKMGIEIPRTPANQVLLGKDITLAEAQKGDIVFYGYPWAGGYYYGHTALVYQVKEDGAISVIHSILPGLMITPLHFDPQPAVQFICIRRIIE